jgi:DNA-binding NarL/FixJ family response regulator
LGSIVTIEGADMTTKDSVVRILVADDSDLIRSGLCSVLQSRAGWVVCGEATDGKEALEKAIRLKPDVILVDISMPHLNGFEVARCIHEQLPDSEVLIVTEHDSRTLAALPSQPGVRGYVMKSRVSFDLIQAVEAASKHQPVSMSPEQKPRDVAVAV